MSKPPEVRLNDAENVQILPNWAEVGPELLKLVREAEMMLRGPTYLMAEQQVIAGLRMGLSWPEKARSLIAKATGATP